MGRDLLSDITTKVLAKALDGTAMRHRVIANNIANVETPGFVRSEVSFECALREALESSDEDAAARRIESAEPEITQDVLSPARPNGNNVSIDREMADVAKNTLQYETLVQLLNMKGMMIRMAITEGKR